MRKFDRDESTTQKLLGITPENFLPIYAPFLLGLVMVLASIVVNNETGARVLFGLSAVVISLSGIGHIRLREVPGSPPIRGKWAVIFGFVHLTLWLTCGVGFLFFE